MIHRGLLVGFPAVSVHAADAGVVLLAGLAGVACVVVAPAVEITRVEVLVVAHLVSNGHRRGLTPALPTTWAQHYTINSEKAVREHANCMFI
jgi:hypothetical protein